jgi:hypothetical protein
MSSIPDGRAANHPLSATTFNPPMRAPWPGALVRIAWIFPLHLHFKNQQFLELERTNDASHFEIALARPKATAAASPPISAV